MGDQHRAILCRPVQHTPVRVPFLPQLIVVVSEADEPLIGGNVPFLPEAGQPGHNIVKAPRSLQGNIAQSGCHRRQMAVRINKGGQQRPSLQIHSLCVGTAPLLHLCPASHRLNPAAAHQQRLLRLLPFHGQNRSVDIQLIHCIPLPACWAYVRLFPIYRD